MFVRVCGAATPIITLITSIINRVVLGVIAQIDKNKNPDARNSTPGKY